MFAQPTLFSKSFKLAYQTLTKKSTHKAELARSSNFKLKFQKFQIQKKVSVGDPSETKTTGVGVLCALSTPFVPKKELIL